MIVVLDSFNHSLEPLNLDLCHLLEWRPVIPHSNTWTKRKWQCTKLKDLHCLALSEQIEFYFFKFQSSLVKHVLCSSFLWSPSYAILSVFIILYKFPEWEHLANAIDIYSTMIRHQDGDRRAFTTKFDGKKFDVK